MESYTLSELGLFIAGIFGGISGLIFALQKSRCSDIKCCGIECHRKLKEELPNANPEVVNP
jgi:hypothetical protein